MVDKAEAKEKEYVLWDDDLRGFGLRVYPNGRKTYIVKDRVNGKQVLVTIGPHGPVTPDGARTQALGVLTETKNGRDPTKNKKANRSSPTMKAFGEYFLQEYAATHLKPSTQGEYRRSVELFINPKLGSRKVTDIEPTDISDLHHSLRNTPYQANRTLGVLSIMFNQAEVLKIRPERSNPCYLIKKYTEKKRERFLSPTEYKALGQTLEIVEQKGTESKSAINAIRLLALTGCRLSEIMTLKWNYVDFEQMEFRLPDSKTGAKTIHFGKAVVDILRSIERIEGNPWVITGKKEGTRLTDLQHPWRRIRDAAQLDDVRLHDLRHSFASGALAMGEGLPMIGKLLGHTQVQTTARYAHFAKDPIKAAAASVSNNIGVTFLGRPHGDALHRTSDASPCDYAI